MKHLLFIALALISYTVTAQETKNKKKVDRSDIYARIYLNYTHSLHGYDEEETAIEIKRAYFGYNYNFVEEFTGFVRLDIGDNFDSSEDTLKRRFAYFRNAGIKYKKGDFSVEGGLINVLGHKYQESFWGKRYISRALVDEYKFTASADMGILFKYKVKDWLKLDMSMLNGEGYGSVQMDNIYKYTLGAYITPDRFRFRLYGEAMNGDISIESMFATMVGYEWDNLRVAAEYSYQSNVDFEEGNDRYGYSIHSTYYIGDKWSLFGRYDILKSTDDESGTPWNISKDRTKVWGGAEWFLNDYFTMSLNYQNSTSDIEGSECKGSIFLNALIDF